MKSIHLLPVAFSILICLPSCSLEFDNLFGKTEPTYDNVDEKLWPYFIRFEEEAAKRGISADLADTYITGSIKDISEAHVLGSCSYNASTPRQVTIDEPFWNKASDLYKEFVVFHELGHCFLGRLHDESKDSKGNCVSIMRSGTGTCRDNYTSTNRALYLDELFSGD